MKPFLYFLGGCEFEYIIHEQKSDPQICFDFGYFHSFEHCAEEQQIRLCPEWFSPPYPDIKKATML